MNILDWKIFHVPSRLPLARAAISSLVLYPHYCLQMLFFLFVIPNTETCNKCYFLMFLFCQGKEGKDGEGSGSESEQTKTKDTETSSPVPTPPRRTSQSYQRRRRSRLSSSGSDTSISNQTNSQNNKQTDVTKPVDIPNKSSQESPGETFASSSSPSKKGFVSRAAAAQAYAESRKMKFDNFEFQLPSPSSQPPPKPPRTMVYGDQEGPSTGKKIVVKVRMFSKVRVNCSSLRFL